MACTRSAVDEGLIACRYGGGPGSTLGYDTPNMGGGYEDNVLEPSADEDECADGLASADANNTEIPEMGEGVCENDYTDMGLANCDAGMDW